MQLSAWLCTYINLLESRMFKKNISYFVALYIGCLNQRKIKQLEFI